MRVQLFSDIHTEFMPDGGLHWLAGLNPTGVDVLIVAGDLGNFHTFGPMLLGLARKYPQVVYVAGNHELYGASFQVMNKLRNELVPDRQNLHWLHNSAVELNGQRFVGTTMWFRDHPLNSFLTSQLTDFRVIEHFRRDVYHENQRAVNFLNKTVRSGDVVVTHHLPHPICSPERFRGNPLNNFYVCNMAKLIEQAKPVYWCFGHTHNSVHEKAGATTLLCNPHGYEGHNLNSEYKEVYFEL